MGLKQFNRIYQEAIKKASFLQPWPGYFLIKKIDAEIILKHINLEQDRQKICLEIGCGNAFQSILFASFNHKIIATDLFDSNNHHHKTGIQLAKRLIESLNAKNIRLIGCSATALPFANDYFDFVFSFAVLEHIKKRDLAFKEMRRVLKPDGIVVNVVPTHMASIYAFLYTYLYILARIGSLMFQKKNRTFESIQGANKDEGGLSPWKRFWKNHPSFPLPEPHGEYRNIADELFSQLPFNWMRLLKNNGFKIKKSFTPSFIPWFLIGPFSTGVAAKFYKLTRAINIKLSSLKKLEYISYAVGFIATKE